jgi:hypothetical protein
VDADRDSDSAGERGERASEEGGRARRANECSANGNSACVQAVTLVGFVRCTTRPPDGQSGPTRVAGTSLHSGERGSLAFLAMQPGLEVLHMGSLHKGLCTLPNTGGLHCWGLDSPYTGCQSHSMCTDEADVYPTIQHF